MASAKTATLTFRIEPEIKVAARRYWMLTGVQRVLLLNFNSSESGEFYG
jgi:hypothetical protein